MEEKFRSWEEERWKKEIEIDEKRQVEDKQHEIQLFKMLRQMIGPTYATNSQSPYDYEY